MTEESSIEEPGHHLRLLRDVATIANETTSSDEAFRRVLQRICDHRGWVGGQVFDVSEEGRPRAAGIHYGCDGASLALFRDWLADRTVTASGGLVDRVIETGEPLALVDRAARGHLAGDAAETLDLRSVVVFPVLVKTRVRAVFECFSSEPIHLDPLLLEVMGSLGTYLGRVVERQESEQRLLDLTEREQRRIGEEIHDTLGQQIVGLGMIAKALQRKLQETGSPAVGMADELITQIRATHDLLRSLASSLTPMLATSNLPLALEDLAEHWHQLDGLEFRTRIEEVTPRQPVATSLYRIAREAVSNAVNHADARQVEIRLFTQEEDILLEVEDDGCGMGSIPDQDSPGLGLRLMRHRATLVDAELELESTPDQGTLVRCRVPRGA